MELNIKIGPYEIVRRTEYSKIRFFDTQKNEDITETHERFLKELMWYYENQSKYPEDFFKIKDGMVNDIADNACSVDIRYMFIPSGITKLNNGAFASAPTKLVNIPDTVSSIGMACFHGCKNLNYIELSSSIKKIEPETFANCDLLATVILPDTITDIGNCAFGYCESLKEIDLPDSVYLIDDFAFCVCENLEEIKLSNSLKIIGKGAFERCGNLKKITLPNTLKNIESYAFSECKNLKEIIIPDSVEEIGTDAFLRCEKLEYIKLPNNISCLSEEIFSNCSSLKKVILPDNINTIEKDAFINTSVLKNINIPKDLYYISVLPFKESSIESITFNHDLESIDFIYKNFINGESDLVSGSNITKLIINSSVKTITPEAFRISGEQIRTIDYNGTKKQFEDFKNNNKKLFELFVNIKRVNFKEEKERDDINISVKR